MATFDVVSKVNQAEVDNALLQTSKEIGTRFDFRDTSASCERTSEGIALEANSEGRVEAILEVLKGKLVKRGVSLKHVDPQKAVPGGKGLFRQLVKIKEGIDRENARKVIEVIKGSKIKVQAAIHEDTVRVSGKNRDDLQAAIALLRQQELPFEMQYVNFRE
ncbi:MAG: YajQ family cyclic di-GMP-binding protein [Myxococcales bacterium]|nr:YajQ family cyclic di-GMP-binding protein [Myxococcales bacterium]